MRNSLYTLIAAFLMVFNANGQIADNRIIIEDVVISETDGNLGVLFTADIHENAVGRNQTYVFNPVLTDGNYRVTLPAIIVEGKGTKLSRDRKEWVSGVIQEYENALYAKPGQAVNYHATVEAQEWMHGSQLRIEGVMGGCCSYKNDKGIILADNIHLYNDPEPIVVITEVKRFLPLSMGDSLSMSFPFVIPESMFDPNDPYKIYDEERDNSMIVFFHQSKHDIVPEYRNNAQTLVNLTAAIEMILADTLSKVERVVVAGFASPEGTYEFNERLAYNRGVAVRDYLAQTTGIRDNQILIFNGAVDWRGLRLLVSRSNMQDKEEIIHILDNTPVGSGNTGRLGKLKALKNGEPYRYMYEEFFPLLRNGAFIKIYYSNTNN